MPGRAARIVLATPKTFVSNSLTCANSPTVQRPVRVPLVDENRPGLNGRMEMNNWVAAGVSEKQLFRALTIDNARLQGVRSLGQHGFR